MSDAKPMTKSEVLAAMAERTGLSKKEVSEFFDHLVTLIGDNLGEAGPGVFNVPGIMKVRVVRKEAKPERKGINPFTKEETIFKEQPAKNVVKVTPLKALKECV